MKRSELEHLIRACSNITGDREITVIGSQSNLGQFPDAPEELLVSTEADVFPKGQPELSSEIDGAIGERSQFHETYGYYAHGVDSNTALLPPGWQERLIRVENPNTGGATGWCLEIHDLAVSKLAAGREKDNAFVKVLAKRQLIEPGRLRALASALDVDIERKKAILDRVTRILTEALRG